MMQNNTTNNAGALKAMNILICWAENILSRMKKTR